VTSPLIVVPGLEHDYVISLHEIDDTVLPVNAPGPSALEHMAQRFGLADTAEWFTKRVLQESIDSLEHRLVSTLPMQVVVPSMRGEDQAHYKSS
jgi:hypothetical protein